MTDILNLSSETVWGDVCYRDFVFVGLKRDGFSSAAVDLLSNWAREISPRSAADFFRGVRGRISAADTELRSEIERAVTYLSELGVRNDTVYRRDTPEKTRVIQWPNNPNTKANEPSHFFDIFTDHFYRNPHRLISKDTPIGSAGSCFALRIAHQLQIWGYNYVIEEDDLPSDFPLDQLTSTSYRMAPARCGTLFNVPSMRQMVERAFGEWHPEKVVAQDGRKWIDPYRSVKPAYQDEAGYLNDYEKHTAALRRSLMKCDVFVLTLGLTEAWYFAHDGSYTSISPWKMDPHLLRMKNLTVEDNVQELERLYAVYKKHKPGIKFIISVSPVPLNKTFSPDRHIVEANSLSKATLRVAAEEFVRRHPDDAFYFPSYEVVTQGTRRAWEEDQRHVSPEAVERVMTLFQKMFLVDQKQLEVARPPENVGPLPSRVQSRGVMQRFKSAVKSVLSP
jgi:hypothetical protein